MSTFGQQYAFSTNAALRQQIAIAAVQQAQVVVAEVNTTQDHTNRLALAQKVMTNPDLWASRIVIPVIEGNANIQNVAPNGPAVDADVFASISSIWSALSDAFAGIS